MRSSPGTRSGGHADSRVRRGRRQVRSTRRSPSDSNTAPSLAPDGGKIAFLHSPHDDGKYDIWVTSTTVANAEQLTNTRNVSDVAWSPHGRLDRRTSQNWSPDTRRGAALARSAERRGGAHGRRERRRARLVTRRASSSPTCTTARSGWPTRTGPNAHQRDPERPRAGVVARQRDDRVHANREVLAERLPGAPDARVRERDGPSTMSGPPTR